MGEFALGLCVIAAALLGALMLTGRLPLRKGARVVVGCFVLLGAPVIATGLMDGDRGRYDAFPAVPPIAADSDVPRGDISPVNYDLYAGASFGRN